ncbi:MAG: hypothetical protein ACRDSI_18530 [Pseudonocardiaceae bacterium]
MSGTAVFPMPARSKLGQYQLGGGVGVQKIGRVHQENSRRTRPGRWSAHHFPGYGGR